MSVDYLRATEQFSDKLAAACRPLQNYSGFNHFCYLRVDNSGKFFIISTNNGLMEYLDDIKSYRNDPHMVNPSNILSGFTAWNTPETNLSEVIVECLKRFNVSHGISYIEKNSDGYTVFGLAAAHNHCPNKVLNNLGYIKKFSNYLKQEAAIMLQTAREEYCIDLAVLKQNFHSQKGIIADNDITNCNKKLEFLASIGAIDSSITDLSFSDTEQLCIKLYLDGHTAKQSAQRLDLSSRTVEKTLDNVRKKLKLAAKTELFALKDLF